MKKYIFISHAAPDDNEFSVWLATKLELCGYKVWLDTRELSPSDDFWKKIEDVLRTDTIKFIAVVSKSSIGRDGVLKEIAVADRVGKGILNFIVPAKIDKVSDSEIPIELVRLQQADFTQNWKKGLQQLLENFEKENVPKEDFSVDSRTIIDRWRQVFSQQENSILQRKDIYYSNLHDIHIPDFLYAYENGIECIFKEKRIPYKKIGNILIAFSCNKCVSKWIDKEIGYEKITTNGLLKKYSDATLLSQKINDIDYHITSLINWNIQKIFYSKQLSAYHSINSKKKVFYFPSSSKHRSRVAKRVKKLSGSYLGKTWHFGLSAYHVQQPMTGVIFRWHLIFTDKTGKLLSQANQIKGRRSKGKTLFNKGWKDLLFTAIDYLADSSEYILYNNCCKESEIRIHSEPFVYCSSVGYTENGDLEENGENEECGVFDE